jgi:long-chain acyl-CoA synthetase
MYTHAGGGPESAPAAAEPQPVPPELTSPLEKRLWAWLAGRFPGKRLALDSSLQLDFGIDSVDWIHLTLEIQQMLGVRLTDRAMSTVITVRDLMTAVTTAQSAPAGAEEISPAERRWLEPRGIAAACAAWCLQRVVRLVMRLGFDVCAEGIESLPSQGPLLIAPNHLSFLDPFALIAVLPWRVLRHTYWAAWTGHMFSGPIRRLGSRLAQCFPVDQDRGPAAGLAMASELLGRGEVLVWFPEGQRSPTGELLPFSPGVGILVAQTGTRVVPVRISGTYEALPRGSRRLRRSRVRVHFGVPVAGAVLEAEGAGDSTEARITDALQRRVAALARR